MGIKKIKHIFDPIFTQNYYIIKAKNLKDYHSVLKKEFKLDSVDEDNLNVTGKFRVCRKKNQDIAVVWSIDNRIDILVHELCHALLWTFSKKGIFVSKGEDEPFCYALQFLVKEALSTKVDKRIVIRK